jgi:chromosome partitioning protein
MVKLDPPQQQTSSRSVDVAAITETCSVCAGEFEVQFRYQMEERDGAFSFFCSQKCLERSQVHAAEPGGDGVVCDACAKRFQPDLVSQVLYLSGRRHYACSLECRGELVREANGVRLGELATPPTPAVAETDAAATPAFAAPDAEPATSPATAVAIPITPAAKREKSGPRVMAIFNHKGGTGKTTTAVSVAAGLASRGKRVLLVDTDAQGNVSVSLGANTERSLYHVLVMGLRATDATREVRPNLHLLPSNETLAAAELYLAGRQNRDRVLSERLTAATANYDFVILDCSPSLSLMNQNALVFADSVLVPVACDYLSLVGVRQVLKTVKNVNALLHHPVQIWGVLPTFFDARAKIAREAVSTLRGHFGERCLPPIRAAIKIKEAPAQGQTIFEYAAGTNAADDYLVVVDRILGVQSARTSESPARAEMVASA